MTFCQYQYFFQMSYIPKLSESLSSNTDRLKVIDTLIQGFEQRLQAQDAYQKSLLRVSQKFGSVNNNLPVFGISTAELSKGHSERSFQIGNYKQQMRLDLSHLKDFSKKISIEIDNKNKSFKKIEKDFKINLEKVEKAKEVSIQSRKDLDEKIILNQIGKLNLDVSEGERKKLFETGTKLAAEQKEIEATYFSSVYQMTDATKMFNSSIQSFNGEINTIANKLKVEFYDFLKKYSIHEINYLRNVEYDMNTWIKKIEVREAEPFQETKLEQLSEYIDSREADGWEQTRLFLVTETLGEVIQQQASSQDIEVKFEKAVQTMYINQFLKQIQQRYKEIKPAISKCLETYRLKNKFKFEDKQFQNLSRIFLKLANLAFQQKDIDFIQKILLFSITYYKIQKNQKRFIIEQLKSQSYFFQLQFWRFFCYFSLRSTISNFKKKDIKDAAESTLHQKNAVYSALLTIATNMLNFGIQKHNTKNFIAKAGKIFPLTEFQITQIIRFIDNQSKASPQKKK